GAGDEAPVEQWADALGRCGRLAEAVVGWREGLAAQERAAAPDLVRVALLHRRVAVAERDRGHLDAATRHLVAAARAAAGVDQRILADVLADRFALAERTGDQATARDVNAELGRLAAWAVDDEVVLAATVTRAGWERASGNLAAAGEAGAEALAAARRAGSPSAELRALAAVLEVAIDAGAAEVIRAHADRLLTLAARWGSPALELRAIGSRAAAGVHDGDWRAMDRDIARCLALSRRFDVPRSVSTVLLVRCLLQVFRGDLAAAESSLAEAGRHGAAVAGDRHVAGDLAMARGQLALARLDRAALAELVPVLRRPGGRNVTWRLLTAAHALVALGRDGELPELAGQLSTGAPDGYRQAVVDWIAGLAPSGDPATALEHLRRAADDLAGRRRPYWAALAGLDLAQRAADGRRAVALAYAEDALVTLDGLGARRGADRARRLLRGLGARPRPARRPGAAGGPLSARELEVARLFAEGLTTAEVAARLVLSPHTVTAHLRRIYERLEVHSRAALTRILVERDLLGPD
ncbi:MAG: helix-turn-helix transcriptional regulator, partial [Pseudonocardia sp.]|nr:helix-turn-helix transcriptional regulator [Pseudonocardia sp.]